MRNDNVINKISYVPFLKTSFCHISLIQILISQNAVFTLPIRKLLLKYVCVKSIDPILWSLSGNDKVYGTNKLKLSCIFLSKSLNITGYLAQIFFKHPIFSIFLIPLIFISNWKRAWSFIWSNLTALNSKLLQVH